ncbi:hypothetical protein N7494_000614 [Penicillium frequentans]|uniref:Reverse transcriptase domain-containing protein n=1 Tax=Penicillium frequentans TaxID=3151616 RepID=A0AAD6GJ53_9EURO|nr:hypothetical protein N7494_000614 [Penicillium glabrum]
MAGKKKKGDSMDESWPEPPTDQNDHEPRAHAKNLLKTTKQWKKSAGEGGLPSLERFVQFLDAVSSLATRIKESDTDGTAATARQRKNHPEPSLRESAKAGPAASTTDQTDPILRAILEAFGKIETSNKYFHQKIEARHVERSSFQSQITELRNELCRRDERYQEEIKSYKVALLEMQKKMEEFKQTAMTTDRTTCACNGHYEELRAELQSLRTAVTSPSTGRSWASIVSQSSVMSPSTRTVRSSLGLPAVVLDLRSANEETKALIDDPAQLREKVRAALKEEATISRIAGRLTGRIGAAIHHLVPVARPSRYGKRWWTRELTALRDTYTWTRNQCTQARRYGSDCGALEDHALYLRRQNHRAIRDAKRLHWREFLANIDNVWKAARYLQPRDQTMGQVPTLRSGEQTVNDDQGKAHVLLETFFPPLPQIQDEPPRDRPLPDALPMEMLTEHEIEDTLRRMAPWKAPGPDGLPVVVWQQVWPTVKHWVVEIFEASLRLSYFPLAWKVAKIVVIPKGGRDPSLPKSYRPISLLATLGKVLEAVVTNCISALVGYHQLLPTNHFGARRTSLIHFTRNQRQRQLLALPLHLNRATVAPASEVKILGVILDEGSRFKSHIGKVANTGMKAVLALRRLRGLLPPVAR